ncbi:hypothetical protein ElyMa_000267100 [Elysia marginata]|uniref:Uncharacterized protein n=1 Tax=Elysia marginata TaxID=1093978 RepID=A0AAV4F4Y1_9GAST|nr:hypothetical protein ElyMa_000267100 [Elysia marginata]
MTRQAGEYRGPVSPVNARRLCSLRLLECNQEQLGLAWPCLNRSEPRSHDPLCSAISGQVKQRTREIALYILSNFRSQWDSARANQVRG